MAKHNDQVNVLSILSLVFGIFFFIPFAPILAVIFGFVGLNQIKYTRERGRGMAIAGIVLGFFWLLVGLVVVIALGAAFFALLGQYLDTVAINATAI